jgi:hypothetical protein
MFDVFIQAAVKVQYLRRAGFNNEVFAVHAVNDDAAVSREIEKLGFDVACLHNLSLIKASDVDKARLII